MAHRARQDVHAVTAIPKPARTGTIGDALSWDLYGDRWDAVACVT
jgi:hypothetical protein